MQKHRSPSGLSCTPHPQHLLPEKTEQKLPRTCAFKAKRHKHHAVLPASCYQSHRPPPPATHRGFATSLQGRAAWQVNKGKHRAAGMKYKSSAICLHFVSGEYSRRMLRAGAAAPVPATPHSHAATPQHPYAPSHRSAFSCTSPTSQIQPTSSCPLLALLPALPPP